MQTYTDAIRAALARTGRISTDPRFVLAYMRLEHGTLDHLSRAAFDREVLTAAECVDYSTTAENEALARSFGLRAVEN